MSSPGEFKHRVVRDLAWTIQSPPLLAYQAPGIRCADPAWCQREAALMGGMLRELDQDPAPLLEALERQSSLRLGKYFECLIAFWLESSPRFALLERNLQISDAKQTYGELDLIVKDQESGRVSHWEVAVKFYLNLDAKLHFCSWVGPNKRDNLQRKADHITEQQAQRSRHPVARQLLKQLGIEVQDAFLFVKGRLFYGPRDALGSDCKARAEQAHAAANRLPPEHLSSWWCTAAEFEAMLAARQLEWHELLKPNWFADQSGLLFDGEVRSPAFLLQRCQTRPTYVVGMLGSRETERGFVVPDSWPSSPAEAH